MNYRIMEIYKKLEEYEEKWVETEGWKGFVAEGNRFQDKARKVKP